jgi:hypothetical protein
MVFLIGRSLSALASEANHKDAFSDWLNSTMYVDYTTYAMLSNNNRIVTFA